MIFLLAMEHLFRLFKNAQDMGLLEKVSKGCERFRVSLYVDDATMFIKLTPHDFQVPVAILNLFAEASGLITNMANTNLYSNQCQQTSLDLLAQCNLVVSSFPYTYLGLPLHFKKLLRSLPQLPIQKKCKYASRMADKFPHLSRPRNVGKISALCNANLLSDCLQYAQVGVCQD
jgi:hypothetical protein